MADRTGVDWAQATWNPVLGCAKVSAGCLNCYAMRGAHRMTGHPNEKVRVAYAGLTQITNGRPQWTGIVRELPERLDQPLRWKKPRRIFVNSMSDLFHPAVSDDFIDAVFAVMALASQHQFQILTKRPERMLHYLTAVPEEDCGWLPGSRARHAVQDAIDRIVGRSDRGLSEEQYDLSDGGLCDHWPLANVWLGVSCEDQKTADERIPLLLQTPAAIRFLSCEPLLSGIDLEPYLGERRPDDGWNIDPPNWVIVGAESGPGARPMDLDWVRAIRDDCIEHEVPLFLKQLAEPNGRKIHTPELDGRRWMEYPSEK